MAEELRDSQGRPYVLREEIQALEKNVDRRFDELSETLRSISRRWEQSQSDFDRKWDSSQRTDWKTWGMFAGLILTVVSLGASPFLRDLTRIERSQDVLSGKLADAAGDRWTETEERDAQRDALAETRRIETLIESSGVKVDDALQREMRLLDDALQREMRMLLDEPLARLSAVIDRVAMLEGQMKTRQLWLAEHDATVSAINATQTTNIGAILDRLKLVESDLNSRDGGRFNRDDYYADVVPMTTELRSRITIVEKELARRTAAIESIEKETDRRYLRGEASD